MNYAYLTTMCFTYSFVGFVVYLIHEPVARWVEGNKKASFKMFMRCSLLSPLILAPLFIIYNALMWIVESLSDKE